MSNEEKAGGPADKKKVKIEVDSHPKHLAPGTYTVSEFKELVAIPAEKDVDQVIDGNLTTLAEDATVSIAGDEVFFSHVKRGGSS